MQSSTKPPLRDAESGFVLIAVIFLAVLLIISLAIAAPKIAMSIQRDRDLETIHRGEQYKRAIRLYYKKFGSYPTSVDQLVESNQIRFLRKRYTDPLTGKDDWKPVLFGQAHVRPLGFFGQPMSAVAGVAAAAGVGGMGGSMYAAAPASTDANGVPVASSGDGSSPATGTSATPGGTTSGSSMFDSNSSGIGSASSGPGSTSSSFGSGSSGFGSTSSPMGSTPGTGFGPSGGFGSSTGSNSAFGSSSTGTPGSSTSGTTFGTVGPIVGITLPVDKPSLIDYKKQTRYNKWEFNYDPMEDQMLASAGLFGGSSNVNNSSSAATADSMNPTTGGTATPGSTTTPGSSPSSSTSSPTSPTSPSSPFSSSPQ